MDIARCICPPNPYGALAIVDTCPIHGVSRPDPAVPYLLNWSDKEMLHRMRIDPDDTAAIADVRQADEDRWRRE